MTARWLCSWHRCRIGQRVAPDLAEAVAEAFLQTVVDSEFGAYRLLTPIDEGSMGEVWRAERADGAYPQQVVLKRLKRDLATLATLRRFLHRKVARRHR